VPGHQSLNKQESQGNVIQGPWTNNVIGAGAKSTTKKGNLLASIKKRSPIAAIALTLGVGGIGITGLVGVTGLADCAVSKKVVVKKFDTELVSMEKRGMKLLSNKLSGVADKGCSSTGLKIFCRFSKMSEEEVAKYEEAGVKVNGVQTRTAWRYLA